MSHSAPLTDTSGPRSHCSTRHTKQARTTSWPERPGEASSAVGVARAGPTGQRATLAVLPRHECDRRTLRLRWR
eukprot:2003372-Prymnesium_polylepis.1